MKGSKLSRWFHEWIDGSTGLTPEQKAFLHEWGLLFLWGGMILGGVLLFILFFAAAVAMRP